MLLPFPAQGHITPTLQFSKRLKSKGVKVTLLSAFIQPEWLQSHITVEDISVDSPEPNRHPSNIENFMKLLQELVRAKLPQVVHKQNNRVSYLVYDSVMPWALDIARQLGLRAAPLFTQPNAVNAILYAVHQGLLKVPLKDQDLPVSIASRLPPLDVFDLPSFIHDSVSFPPMLRLLTDQFSNFKQADCIFCNSFDALEQHVLSWVTTQWPVKNIGPTVPSMYLDKRLKDDKDYGVGLFKSETDTCMEWLDSKADASVIYVAFGSLAAVGVEQMEEIALGLINSDRNFLWVVRETEVKKLPSNFIEETRESGLVVSWCHQVQVLAHKAVGCFVSHCGWKSTIEALCLGVPMVGLPQWSDQPTNAKFVMDVWEVGVRAKGDAKGMVTRREIERCIREVTDGKRGTEITINSRYWKNLAKAAMDEGGSSDLNIQQFVASLP